MRSSSTAPCGGVVTINYEALFYPQERVAFWAIDGPMTLLMARRGQWKLSQAVRQEWQSWASLWTKCGYDPSDVFSPSTACVREARLAGRSAQHRGSLGDPRFVSEKAAVRTDGFLVLHCLWAAYGRKWRRNRGLAMLQALFVATVDRGEVLGYNVDAFWGRHDASERCDCSTADGKCGHVYREWLSIGQHSENERVYCGLAKELVVLTTAALSCSVARSMLRDKVRWLQGMMDLFLHASTATPDADLFAQAGPKRRIHERVRKFCLLGGLRARRHHTSSQAATSIFGQERGGRLANKWVRRDNAIYVARAQRAYGSGLHVDGVHSVCPDASRHGRPAKDFLVTPMWQAANGVAMWLPPQDRG